MKIRWFAGAVADLVAMRAYIAKEHPDTAKEIAERILDAVELLAEQPSIGRPGRVEGTRELVFADLPYIIPYRVRNNMIEILRVFHAARQWPQKL